MSLVLASPKQIEMGVAKRNQGMKTDITTKIPREEMAKNEDEDVYTMKLISFYCCMINMVEIKNELANSEMCGRN